MYYAYSISLMSFLRTRGDEDLANRVFEKLKLSVDQKTALLKLLETDADKSFTKEQIQKIIEPILGPATRQLGAEQTAVEFLKDPKSSPLFSSANYGIEYELKRQLTQNQSPLATLIDNDFSLHDFEDAEIYRVAGIKEAMSVFVSLKHPAVLEEFEKKWAELLPTYIGQSDDNINFHKRKILSEIIQDKTVAFFEENEYTELNTYTQHLNTNYEWGTEETLLVLHRAIVGEQKIRDPITNEVRFLYDSNISVGICRDGVPVSPIDENADIVLNNYYRNHWVSLIPVIPPKPLTEPEMRAIKLQISGFNKCLEELHEIEQRLQLDGFDLISSEATQLILDLTREKTQFLKLSIDSSDFKENCSELIKTAAASAIGRHHESVSWFSSILATLLNATIAICSLGIANIVTGRFEIITPTSNNHPAHTINAIRGSLAKIVSEKDSDSSDIKDVPPRP
jgi:hypothetical protein